MLRYTALVSLIAVAFYVFLVRCVAGARRRFGLKPPATTGHSDFERVYRVQMNTLEWMPIFLVSLWLFAIYVSDVWAAALGVVWIIGRAIYYAGYVKATEKRLPGFFIQASACFALFAGALIGIVTRLLHP